MKSFVTFLSAALTLLTGFVAQASGSPQDVLKDEVTDKRIKSVMLYREGWNLSYPVIKFNSGDKLILDFDLLADQAETYYYSFIHCSRDWKESGIFQSDFIDGPNEDIIEDYKPSFNTRQNFYHYSLSFPNDRMNPRLSGNYIIKVYSSGNPDKPLMTKRFMITEESAAIAANAHRPDLVESYNTGQQVDFTVSFPGLRVNDPGKDVSSIVLQNGKWSDAKVDLKPDIVGSNELKYNSLSGKNIFPGGNEYRNFDIKSILYQTEYIRKIDFADERYQIFLLPSDDREFKPYFFEKDLNGKYYVAIKEGKNMETDADYVYVYFTIRSRNRIEGGDIYVSGALANWEYTDLNRMIYDQQRGEYQCSMLLKQGWYNYEYIFLKKGDTGAGPSYFEGNHYETENDYLILVYYRNPRDRYDRLIGSLVTNSSKKQDNRP